MMKTPWINQPVWRPDRRPALPWMELSSGVGLE